MISFKQQFLWKQSFDTLPWEKIFTYNVCPCPVVRLPGSGCKAARLRQEEQILCFFDSFCDPISSLLKLVRRKMACSHRHVHSKHCLHSDKIWFTSFSEMNVIHGNIAILRLIGSGKVVFTADFHTLKFMSSQFDRILPKSWGEQQAYVDTVFETSVR